MNNQFLSRGKIVEADFAKTLSNHTYSTKKEDILEHWDVSTQVKYDVKGLKKINRADLDVDENIHWVELKNVNGDKGWLYGDADYFTFELINYWIIVDKFVLQDYIAKNTVKKYKKVPTLNKLYRREGRQDVLTLVKSLDLIYISKELVKKI